MDRHSLEHRILRLERANRILVLGLSILALGLGSLVLTGQIKSTITDVVHTRALNVVNDEGRVVVHLGVRSNGAGGFWLANKEGAEVLKLNQTEEGGGRILVFNSQGVEMFRVPD
jgi:hypothetical protein